MDKNITFLGAGSMAEAIIVGLLKKKVVAPNQITVTNLKDQERLQYLSATYHVQITNDRPKAVEQADIIIFAMKPNGIKDSIDEIKDVVSEKQLFISVLAGIPTIFIEELLNIPAAVIRTMPNTSAIVGASATAMCKGQFATDKDLHIVQTLLEAVGIVLTVDEEKMDAVTGIAGSGPAYLYYFVEGLYHVAAQSGLTTDEATKLITQTIVGVGKRLEATNKSAGELYQEVMSPNGTTEAGFQILEQYHTQQNFEEAVSKAITRSKQLGAVFSEKK
ncbi:pyrroline-5-carboxylate reductase [Alkalihalobacillus alcalophilus ATCC 27647 = CGMCC 1.3604]|uniref:Pyrroline-5-carboxylate reductase n=2 Tax=Alkalihalobacillus alcalophilus ATCC 27647 = CGMCC 1.3604 TaxID=1218173 RepID=A0A4V3X858_ALKAL|nr:pyrroline-5-carboxylate reductase [Alkalihalobacillus alcalophilus]MED1563061.1 pyrroline-5-carboxylate reductase [Alkalihalobacillus alcalophilus]THG88992.1 pyrroline-5-carboxylate reductase [Alkalihalobacillus alcalophilus ATCC 27647 = CGMCC 1.3604]